VHTLPAAELLRENLPDAKLTWIVEAPFVELLQNNPVVDDVMVFPKKAIAKELSNPLRWLSPSSEFRRFVDDLKSRKVTAAIDFQGLFKSGAIAFLSGASTRVGFAQSRELSSMMLTHKMDAPDYFANDKHVVLHNLELSEFYLRIACGIAPNSRIISFPLPNPGKEIYLNVLNLVNDGGLVNSNTTSLAADREQFETGSDQKSGVLPQAGSGGTGDAIPPVKSDAADGATVSSQSGGSGGVRSTTRGEDSAQPYAAPSPDSISQAGAEPPVGSTPSAAPFGSADTEPPAAPHQSPKGPVKVAQMPGWSMFPGSRVEGSGDDAVQETIATRKASGEKLIVLIPGTTWITKIWPKEKWAELVSQLVQVERTRIVLVGGPSETEMNSYIYDRVSNRQSGASKVIDLTGKTSLRGLIALFTMADIVVGADTGPLHMACAANVPHVIGVFGSTPWKRNGPIGEKSSVVALDLSCQPCFEKTCPLQTIACLKDLDVAQVESEVKRIFGL